MARYDYRCPDGHTTEKIRSMKGPHPRTVRCGSCRKKASRVYAQASVIDDFPEHFNISMGCVVKNRKHHEQLQKERGLQDWVPTKETPMLSRLRREGFRV